MKLAIQNDHLRTVESAKFTEEELESLHRNLKELRMESPDYPDAWGEKALENFDELVRLLDQSNTDG
jgi:hypothetical protein